MAQDYDVAAQREQRQPQQKWRGFDDLPTIFRQHGKQFAYGHIVHAPAELGILERVIGMLSEILYPCFR